MPPQPQDWVSIAQLQGERDGMRERAMQLVAEVRREILRAQEAQEKIGPLADEVIELRRQLDENAAKLEALTEDNASLKWELAELRAEKSV
jgi:chromosome segregation ATPase